MEVLKALSADAAPQQATIVRAHSGMGGGECMWVVVSAGGLWWCMAHTYTRHAHPLLQTNHTMHLNTLCNN